MDGKLTLITPPDFYENLNTSILFMHLTEEEQCAVSSWFKDFDSSENLNLYVYNGELNIPWILYAFNRCDYTYLNLDNQNSTTQTLSGYYLANSNVWYKTEHTELSDIYNHINGNRVDSIEHFLERILIVKKS